MDDDDWMAAFTAYRLVSEFFEHSIGKTSAWFETPNPLLGHVRPIDLLNLGRGRQLLEIVATQLRENSID